MDGRRVAGLLCRYHNAIVNGSAMFAKTIYGTLGMNGFKCGVWQIHVTKKVKR